ncbi:proline aminopeptidase II [Escherichia coli]|uniref:Xaa-Pro aminopeptidase n=1 Tax=Escherichia coli TaxID=562 RepID=A0A376Y440_ECOLX|nr:proline aminopeptidase II [Escherichia coli]
MSEISRQEFQRRRQALVEQMQPGSAALIFAAPEVTRSADSEYPYRQNSDFWYFTGFNEPEAVLVLIKSDDTHNHSVLFNRVRDLTAEIWFGRRLGQDAAPEKTGALTAHWHSVKSISNFINYLTAWMWFTMLRANMHMLMKS